MVSILIKEIEEYAIQRKVPIMSMETLRHISKIIKDNNIISVLEVGTAIGYSALFLKNENKNIKLTTIEREASRYSIACENIARSNFNNIQLIFGDALSVEIKEKYDLIIIDAAKSQNIKFFDKYKNNLSNSGIIIFDNMNFHGLVWNVKNIESRNLRSMVKKIELFWKYIDNQNTYLVEHIEIGDGIVVCKRKNT